VLRSRKARPSKHLASSPCLDLHHPQIPPKSRVYDSICRRDARPSMAALHSIGVRKPAALPYLIAESILPEDCTERDYTWETYYDSGPASPAEEVVTTEYHVVWSRGGVVRKVFNFELEKDSVVQALLTWFPIEEHSVATSQSVGGSLDAVSSRTFLTQGTQPATDPNAPITHVPTTTEVKSRALVVFLSSQAHVFFLSGTTHVVNLPFEVDKVFATARGVIVQRKIYPRQQLPPSPQLPSAPPNSFLTNNQSFLSQSFSHSFAQPHRHGSSLGPPRNSMRPKPNPVTPLFLEELVKGSTFANTEALPRLYSFTDPLAELGLVVSVIAGNERAGLMTVNGSGHRRLEALDKAEEILYVSRKNEIVFDRSGNDKPLLLVVTANYETNVFTIWSAAYLEPKSISHSRKQHTSLPAHRTRRRSSYGPTAPGTGATTPAARGHDRPRESIGGAGRSKKQPSSLKTASQTKERLSDQAVEDALASQLNPVFDMSRQPRESRRVSSLLSRAELSTSFDKIAFKDLATQRHSLGGGSFSASFGASQRSRHSLGNDRMSFGGFSHSRNRASTPGSIASYMSMGGGSIDDSLDDIMDDTFDTIEDYDELDDLFAPLDKDIGQGSAEGLRKELVMSVVAEIPAQRHLKAGFSSLNDQTINSQVRACISRRLLDFC
jgi:anaphase-promoting complex subunit 1